MFGWRSVTPEPGPNAFRNLMLTGVVFFVVVVVAILYANSRDMEKANRVSAQNNESPEIAASKAEFDTAREGDLVYVPGGIVGHEYWRVNGRMHPTTLAVRSLAIEGVRITFDEFTRMHAHVIPRDSGQAYEFASSLFVRDRKITDKTK